MRNSHLFPFSCSFFFLFLFFFLSGARNLFLGGLNFVTISRGRGEGVQFFGPFEASLPFFPLLFFSPFSFPFSFSSSTREVEHVMGHLEFSCVGWTKPPPPSLLPALSRRGPRVPGSLVPSAGVVRGVPFRPLLPPGGTPFEASFFVPFLFLFLFFCGCGGVFLFTRFFGACDSVQKIQRCG